MRKSSIRLRITALAAISVAVVLALASVGLVALHRRQLTTNLDLALAQRASDLSALASTSTADTFDLAATAQEGFAQLLGVRGEVVAASPNLRDSPPLPITYVAGTPETIQTVNDLAVDDDVFRVLSRTVETANGPGTLHIGATLDDVIESTTVLTGALIVSIPAVAALLAALVWWLVGRTLEPVESIRKEVAEIRATDLHRRVPLSKARDEIGRLAETMNSMLERLETSVEQQQRFVGDASHELRTPLARMRAEIEVDLAVSPDEARLQSLREEVIVLQRLVEDLLLLSKLDSDRIQARVQPVDLDDLVLKEARRLKADGRVAVEMSGISGAHVNGDPDQLARAIRNLSDNAEGHAAGSVTFVVSESGGRAIVTIGDDGPGIPPEFVDTIFERFVRVDDSRGQTTGGFGLGLAITREIIERHGGTVELDPVQEHGARFVVSLPLG